MRQTVLLATILAGSLLGGCADGPPAAPTQTAATGFYPPLPAVPAQAARPPAPSPGLVWLPAAYEWNGGSYDLVPGRWEAPVREDALWQPGHWAPGRDGRYAWVKGHWVAMP